MVKITTDGYLSENRDEIFLDEITCTYIQNHDCTESRDDGPQMITLSSRDGGGGKFINIQTKSWSITGEDFEKEIIPLLSDFKARMKGWCTND